MTCDNTLGRDRHTTEMYTLAKSAGSMKNLAGELRTDWLVRYSANPTPRERSKPLAKMAPHGRTRVEKLPVETSEPG